MAGRVRFRTPRFPTMVTTSQETAYLEGLAQGQQNRSGWPAQRPYNFRTNSLGQVISYFPGRGTILETLYLRAWVAGWEGGFARMLGGGAGRGREPGVQGLRPDAVHPARS
jgi:hypothetical protein